MPTNAIAILVHLAGVREFIMDNYQACGGLSALVRLNKLEAAILTALDDDQEAS